MSRPAEVGSGVAIAINPWSPVLLGRLSPDDDPAIVNTGEHREISSRNVDRRVILPPFHRNP
jgi:hypothetical protein